MNRDDFKKQFDTILGWNYQIFEDDVGYNDEEDKQDLKLSQSEVIEYRVNKPSQKRVVPPHIDSIRSSTPADHPRQFRLTRFDPRPTVVARRWVLPASLLSVDEFLLMLLSSWTRERERYYNGPYITNAFLKVYNIIRAQYSFNVNVTTSSYLDCYINSA